jgi:hypothetical protein
MCMWVRGGPKHGALGLTSIQRAGWEKEPDREAALTVGIPLSLALRHPLQTHSGGYLLPSIKEGGCRVPSHSDTCTSRTQNGAVHRFPARNPFPALFQGTRDPSFYLFCPVGWWHPGMAWSQ